jgi:hypothetical protein
MRIHIESELPLSNALGDLRKGDLGDENLRWAQDSDGTLVLSGGEFLAHVALDGPSRHGDGRRTAASPALVTRSDHPSSSW